MIAQGVPMPPDVLAAVRKLDAQAPDNRSSIEIWPDMAPGVLTFFALDTQWLRGPMGEALGVNYMAIKPTADLLGLTADQQAFHDIRILENEALRAMRAKRHG